MPSLLRTRLMEDLRIRNYSPRTIATYVRCVALFAKHFGRSPEELAEDQIREYQRYLVDEKKASWTFFNQTVCALKFFYGQTLKREGIVKEIPFPKQEKRLPEVLSVGEVSKLFSYVPSLVHRTILQTMYAAGLRLTEALELKPGDIDRRADGDSSAPGERAQGPLRDAVAHSVGDVARVLQGPPSEGRMAIPEPDGKVPDPLNCGAASLSTSFSGGALGQTSDHAYHAPQFCHSPTGSGNGSEDDSDPSGTREPEHHGGLPSYCGGSSAVRP